MAPATERGALIVSHGQPSDRYPAEEALKLVASQVASCLSGWTIASATMAARDTLEQALEQHPAAAIYPLFMADGWFTGTALPDRLLKGQRRVLPPLGLDRNLPLLAADILTRRLNDLGWEARETRLVIAAHGGQHSANPARAARQFAAILASLTQFADIRVGFVAQAPDLCEIARAAEQGARRALADVGLDGPEAAIDIHDLRTLLDSLRMARRTAWRSMTCATHSHQPPLLQGRGCR